MAAVDRHAPVRFLRTVFEPTDWVAIFLKSYERSRVAQRVGPVSWVQSERFQRWLRAMNARKYNVFVSVNAIASGRRSRTRDAIGAVRHVFLDADHDGAAVLSRVEARRDLPSPSYILHSSPNHIHVFWRVTGFDSDLVERLQKQLARELQTDPAATPVTQNTRLPGFFNHKRAQPHLVTIEYRNVDVCYGPADFPPIKEAATWPRIRGSARASNFDAPGHRAGKAVPGLGAARDCRPARRRPHVSRLLPARHEGSRWTRTRRYTCCRSGTRDASRHGHRPSCSTSSAALLGTAASQLAGCCDAPGRDFCRIVRPPARSSQVFLNSRVHRGTSTDFSVTAHALIEPMRPTLVRRHP